MALFQQLPLSPRAFQLVLKDCVPFAGGLQSRCHIYDLLLMPRRDLRFELLSPLGHRGHLRRHLLSHASKSACVVDFQRLAEILELVPLCAGEARSVNGGVQGAFQAAGRERRHGIVHVQACGPKFPSSSAFRAR
eukprot:scaffold1954_cov268-Pinguiococcus_pyrenoidosus.AAC.70